MNRSTVLAVVVFVALGVGAYVSLTEEPERGISRISLQQLDTDAIDTLEVAGEKPVKLKKTDGTWRLLGGKEADESAVTSALSALSKVESSDLVSSDPERFGELEVDEEKGARVTAYAAGKAVADLVLGSSSGGGTHVRVGDDVYRVKSLYKWTFSKPLASWQNRKLFEDKLSDVVRVDVSLAGETPYSLVKNGDAWELADASVVPGDFRFDASAAGRLVSSLVNLRAKEILDADPGEETTGLGDAADRWVIHVKAASGGAAADAAAEDGQAGEEAAAQEDKTATETPARARELVVGRPKDDGTAHARVAGSEDVVVLQSYSLESLRKKATDLRDTKLVELDPDKVTKLSIVGDKGSLDLDRQGAEWKVGKSSETIPGDFVLDQGKISQRLSQMSSARALSLSAVQSAATAGLRRPKATIRATMDDGTSVTLAFGSDAKDGDRDAAYVKSTIDGKVYLASKWTKTSLTGGLDTFKKDPEQGGLANLDPKALQNLPPDVRKSLEAQLKQKQKEQELLKAIEARSSK